MDANQFDIIAKALISETNRRRTLGGLLGGALAALGLANAGDADAAKSRDCKNDCGPCETCKLGTCRKKNGKKHCKPGTCQPKSNGSTCTGSGGTCQNGACLCGDGKPNCGATCCRADQVCQNGTCVCPAGTEECGGACVPACDPDLQARNPDTCACCFVGGIPICPNNGFAVVPFPLCCSGLCNPLAPPIGACAPGANGDPCNVDAQCTSNNCENGLCAA